MKEVTPNPASLQDGPHRIIYYELPKLQANSGGKVLNATNLYEESQALMLVGSETNGNVLMLGMVNMLEQSTFVGDTGKGISRVWPDLGNAPPKFEKLG